MESAYLNSVDNSAGLPVEIVSDIKNNVTDNVACILNHGRKMAIFL